MSLSTQTPKKMHLSKLQLPQLLPNLFAGLILGLVTLTYCISFAALIFSGSLSPSFAQGLGSALIGSVIVGTVVAAASGFPFAIAGIDANGAPILALMASAIAQELQATGKTESLFPTVWIAIALSTFLTGIFLYGVGKLRLGRWVRFIPYPVMGGFLAGMGWTLTRSSFKVMAGLPLGWGELPRLMQPDILMHWLPGVIFALVLMGVTRYYKHVLVLPTMLLGAIALFHLLWWLVNAFVKVPAKGWFLEPFPKDRLWQAWNVSTITQVDWAVLAHHSGNMIVLMIVLAIAILLNAAGIELATEQDSQLDKELCANGIANMLAGLCGGTAGNLSVNRTLLNRSAGANSPLAATMAMALCGTVLLFSPAFLAYIPRAILGGLLLTIGLKLLIEWVYSTWFKFPHLEYTLILIIMVTIATLGFIQGVGVGIIVACALFAFNYSRHQVVRHAFCGTTHQSNVVRSFPDQRFLRHKGDQIYILLLQGYIFFGTANALLEQVKTRLKDLALLPLQFLVLDFRLVSGLDSSAVLSFIKMRQLAQKHQLRLVFTHLTPTIEQQLASGRCIVPDDTLVQIFPELDRGIEWCEDQILETLSLRRRRALPLALQLNEFFANADFVSSFMSYLEQIQVPAEHILFHQGDSSDALYFIESGQVTVFLQLEGGQTRRLQTLGASTIMGEIAFYLGTPHKTSAITDQPSKLHCLTTASLQTMQRENPQATSVFHEFVIRLLADRLNYAYEGIEELL